MRNKLLAVIVSLGVVAVVSTIPAASARSARGDSCPPGNSVAAYCSCPEGTQVPDYCECPGGTTQVGAYCESPGGTIVAPQRPPTVFRWFLWGAKHRRYHGPSLKFHLHKGIDGAPGIKSFKLFLPPGFTFSTFEQAQTASNSKSKLVTVTDKSFFVATSSELTVTLRSPRASLLVYLRNHLLHESSTVRRELIGGTIKHLTFHVNVTDSAGKTTDLAFVVTPGS